MTANANDERTWLPRACLGLCPTTTTDVSPSATSVLIISLSPSSFPIDRCRFAAAAFRSQDTNRLLVLLLRQRGRIPATALDDQQGGARDVAVGVAGMGDNVEVLRADESPM